MDEPHISHPDVISIVQARARYWLPKLRHFHDIDEESLFQDFWGDLVRAKYDPTQSSPPTFARNVVDRRALDRLRNLKSKAISNQLDPDTVLERGVELANPAEELPERARQIYEHLKGMARAFGFSEKRGPGRPPVTFEQKTALVMLQKEMRWSSRQAEEMTRRYPDILAVVGVTETRSHMFFSRASRAVTKFAKKENRRRVLAGLPPTG